MAFIDPMQKVIDLLNNEWQSKNTDNLTPKIVKITDLKRIDFFEHKDWILVHRSNPDPRPGGLGTAIKHVEENLKLDIRSKGEGREEIWRMMKDEAERILDNNIINPTNNFDEYTVLDPDGDRTELSDKTFHVWRILINFKLIKLSKAR